MRVLSDILYKGSVTADGVVAFNNTATGQTPLLSDNSSKLATTTFVKSQGYLTSVPIATASVLGGIIVGSGLSVDASGVLSVSTVGSGNLITRQTFTATLGQTVFTITGGYTVGLIDVFVNGARLNSTSVTATDGSTIVLTDAAEVGDIVDVVLYAVLTSGFAFGSTDNVTEGTVNLYFTTARARGAVSGTAGRITYTAGVFDLATSGATAGTYGSSSAIPTITVDAYGRITSISTTGVSIVTTLAALTDVSITSPVNGQLLQYNSAVSDWVNWTPNYLTGTGTTNYVSKWTGSSAQGDSLIYDNGSIVAIGTTSSTFKFTIQAATNDVLGASISLNNTSTGTSAGTYVNLAASGGSGFLGVYGSTYSNTALQSRVVLGTNSNASGINITANGSATQDIRLFVQSGEVARLSSSRNFLLGLTTDSGYRLDVSGTTRIVGPSANDAAGTGGEILTSSGWTSTGWTGDFATGFTHTTGNTTALTNTYSIGANQWMLIALTVTGRTAGSVTISLGGGTIGPYTATTTVGLRGFSTSALSIAPTTDFDGTITISIKSAAAVAATSSWTSSSGSARIEFRTINSADNVLIGVGSGARMNTVAVSNTFLGGQAGSYQVTGSYNTYIGAQAGQYATSASNNTFIGALTGVAAYNTTNSIYIGVNAGYNVTGGNFNIYIGGNAGNQNATGTFNSVVGGAALAAATNGSSLNTVMGYGALGVATTATNTVALGYQAGYYQANLSSSVLTTTNSIFLGYRARPNADAETNQIAIGYNVAGLGSNTTVLGNSSTTLTALYGSTVINATSIQASAVLQADSTSKGFLPPRMTSAQRTAISSPATGLVVYQTDGTEGLYIKTASAWKALAIV